MTKLRKPLVPMKYPVGVELSYRKILRDLVKELQLLIKKHLSPIVVKMVLEVTSLEMPTGLLRQDAWADDLDRALEKILRDMVPKENAAIKNMRSIGGRVNQFNKDEWKRLIRSQYGIDPTSEDPEAWNTVLTNFAHDNARLIKDIPQKTMQQIKESTIEALKSGRSQRDMADDIFETMTHYGGDVTEARANLIARDQVAKLNGQFTHERQTNAGVESYIWRTVGDERVRETHELVDGQTFSWDLPPTETDGNHPGEDYQCRCWAEPILPEVMEFEASLLAE